MESKHVGALILIIFGASFLAKNLHITSGMFWPILLIVLGGIALYQASSRTKSSTDKNGEVIWEVNGNSSLFKGLVAIPVLLIVIFTGLIILGVLGPFFLLFLLFIPAMLFIKLGWAFVRLLLPIVFAAAPLLLVLWVLTLIF